MPLVRSTAPTAEPVTMEDFLLHSKVDELEDLPSLNRYLIAAREWAEAATGRQLMTATYDLYLDHWPEASESYYGGGQSYSIIRLPRPPLQSVSFVKYVDTGGTLTTISSSNYTVDTYTEPGRVYPSYGNYWPSHRAQPNAIQIRFIAGYSGETTVPAGIKELICLVAAECYENREPTVTGTIVSKFEDMLNRFIWKDLIFDYADCYA